MAAGTERPEFRASREDGPHPMRRIQATAVYPSQFLQEIDGCCLRRTAQQKKPELKPQVTDTYSCDMPRERGNTRQSLAAFAANRRLLPQERGEKYRNCEAHTDATQLLAKFGRIEL